MIITFLASYLIWVLFAGLLYLWIIDGRVKKEVALHAFFAAIIALGIAEILKIIFHTTRPFVLEGLTPLTLTIPNTGAFPSTHTAVAFALSISVWRHNKKIGWLFLAVALTIGLARVLALVHWPIDIAGGIAVGLFVAIGLERLHAFPLLHKLRH